MGMSIFQQRLRERLDASGLSMHALSKKIGANPGYVRDLLDPDKGGTPTGARLIALASALGTSGDYLLGGSGSAEYAPADDGLADPAPVQVASAAQHPTLPLIRTGECAEIELLDEAGAAVAIECSTLHPSNPVRMAARPPALVGATDVFAIYFRGQSMEPRFWSGEVGLVDPDLPVRPGDYVLVQLTDSEHKDAVVVLTKRFVGKADDEILLEQHNPGTTFSIPADRVSRIDRILELADVLFG